MLGLEVVREVVRHDEPELKAEDNDKEQTPVSGCLNDTSIRSATMSGHHQRPDRVIPPGRVRQLLRDPGEHEEQRQDHGTQDPQQRSKGPPSSLTRNLLPVQCPVSYADWPSRSSDKACDLQAGDTVVRTRINRHLGRAVTAALDRLPALEMFTNARADTRRLHTKLVQTKRRGIRIDTVYDIGAHRGEWTRETRASLPDAEFILFEANEVHATSLEGERFYIGVLSSQEKLVQFWGNGGPGDSYFRETTDVYDGVAPVSVQATTLDHLIQEHGLPRPDFIKADVQGAELDVLDGGRNALDHAKLVLLECPIADYNEGAPNIHEYFSFMDECGFTPIDFVGRACQNGRVIQIDVLFADVGADHRVAR